MKKKNWAKKTAYENLKYVSALLFLIFILAVLLGFYIGWMFNFRDSFMLLSGIVIGTCIYYMVEKVLQKKFLPRYAKYKGLIQGIAGEDAVNYALKNKLGKENLVIADAVLNENIGNIDHIIIGQYGIFVVETKTHRGRIVCDNDRWIQYKKIGESIVQIDLKYSPSKQARSNAAFLRDFLKQYYPTLSKEWINAIVVFPNKQFDGDYLEIKKEPQECKIFDSIDKMIDEIKKITPHIKLTPEDFIKLENIFMPIASDTTITN